MESQAKEAIHKVVQDYFMGIFEGDIDKLRSIFRDSTVLYGNVQGMDYEKDRETYLEGVANRQSPKELNETFNMKVLSTEVVGNIGLVQAHVPMLGFHYHDFLTLVRYKDKWKIVGKTFTDINP